MPFKYCNAFFIFVNHIPRLLYIIIIIIIIITWLVQWTLSFLQVTSTPVDFVLNVRQLADQC